MNLLNNFNKQIELKRYPLHTENNGEKKMDLYIYNFNNIKLAYLSVAKCASNEIRNIFKNLCGSQERLEINIKDKNDLRIKDLIIFSFIRNPHERFHSAFNMMYGNTSLNLPAEFLEFSKNPDNCKITDPGHWTPQYNQLITENGYILPEYIGNINNLYEHIEDVLNKYITDINDKNNLIHKLNDLKIKNHKIHVRNKNFNDNSYYLEYYNKETYKNVSNYLKTDLELFTPLDI